MATPPQNTDQPVQKPKRRSLVILSIVCLALLMAVGYSLNDQLQYQAVIREARSLGMTLTKAETDAQIEKTASTDVQPYRDLLAKFTTTPVLQVDGNFKTTVSPADVRKSAPWFFDDVAACVAEPRYDPTPFLNESPKSLYCEYRFVEGIPRILTRDILADINQNRLDRAKKTAQSLYGWFKFIDIDTTGGIVPGRSTRYQWLISVKYALARQLENSPQAKTLKELALATPDPPPTKNAFLTWYHIPTAGAVDGLGETGDQYGQRMYTTYTQYHYFKSGLEATLNFPYFNLPGYSRRSSKLQLEAVVAAIRNLPEDADDLTFAKAIDAEFARRAATYAPGTVELADVPGAFTNFAQERQDLIKLRKSIGNPSP